MSPGLHAVFDRVAPTSLLVLALLALSLLPAPPGPAAAAAVGTAAGSGPASVLPPDHRDQLAALRGDLTEHPGAVARSALHRAVASLTGPQTAPASDPESAGPRLLTAAGDLNADGVGDAVEIHGWLTSTHPRWLLGGHLSATAVNGRQGGTLWSRSFDTGSGWDEYDYGFGTAVPMGDLDGVAGDDLLVIDVAEQRYGEVWSWGIRYAGVAGRDGAELWRRTYHNPSVFETNASFTGFVDINLAVPLSADGDADGDGVSDLLIGRHHYVFGYSDDTYVSRQAQVMGFDVLSGATGAVLSRIVEPDLPATAEAAFVPDVTGDGRDDVVTVAGAAAPVAGTWAGVVSAYHGMLGTPVWRVPLTAPGVPQVSGQDLTGDGSGEVVVLARGWSLAAADLVTTVQVLSGGDGQPLWSHREDGIALLLRPGDATGDGGVDLLTARVFQHGDEMLRLTLLDGASGRTGWSSVHAGGLVEFAGDVTGDRAADLLVRPVPYIGDDSRQPVVVVSSRTGDEVWSLLVGVADRLHPLFADLDRDGADDVVHDTPAAASGTYQVLGGRDGTPLWQRPARYGGRLLRLDAVTGTADGGPNAPRILQSACRCDGAPGGHVTTARDTAGLRVWRRVDGTPLPPPATTTLRLVGDPPTSGQYSDQVRWRALLVTGGGDPVPDAEVTFGSGSVTATAVTDAAGVATVTTRLTDPPGDHPLEVRYGGDDDHRPSVLTHPFTIEREQVALSVDLSRGGEWALTAVLTDRDDPGHGLGGRWVEFRVDGVVIGSAVTDRHGVARHGVPPRHHREEGRYAARFAGDAYYLPA